MDDFGLVELLNYMFTWAQFRINCSLITNAGQLIEAGCI